MVNPAVIMHQCVSVLGVSFPCWCRPAVRSRFSCRLVYERWKVSMCIRSSTVGRWLTWSVRPTITGDRRVPTLIRCSSTVWNWCLMIDSRWSWRERRSSGGLWSGGSERSRSGGTWSGRERLGRRSWSRADCSGCTSSTGVNWKQRRVWVLFIASWHSSHATHTKTQ